MCNRNSFDHIFRCKSGKNGQCLPWPGGWLCKVKRPCLEQGVATILLVDALNWEVTYKDLVNKVVCDPSNCECMMHRCTNCPGTNALRKFLEEELSDIDPDFQFHYSQ